MNNSQHDTNTVKREQAFLNALDSKLWIAANKAALRDRRRQLQALINWVAWG